MLSIPPVIGHRGAKAHAPENTLAGLRTAAAQGAPWVEVDVMLSRDGVPILMHDDTLNRTTSGRGPVDRADLADIRALDAGAWFAPAFAGERVPTLEEALDCALDLGLGLNLEIKPTPGRAVETAEVALDVARRRWPADRPPPLVSSFELSCLETATRLAPDWPRGYLIWKPPPDWAALADHIGAATLNVDQNRLTRATVETFRSAGRPVLAYTVNSPARARELFAWGVAAVFTDTPATILAAVRP